MATSVAPRSTGPRIWLGIAFGVVTALIWGIQPIISKLSIADGLTAADVTLLRFIAASAVLAPLMVRAGRFPIGHLGWPRAIALCVLAGAPFSLCIVGGVAFAPALHSAVVSPGLIPLVAMGYAFVVAGERPAPARLLAVVLILAGLALFSFEAIEGAPTRQGAWRGDLLFMLSACMWAGFGFYANRWRANSLEATAAVAFLSLVSAPLWAFWSPLHMLDAGLGSILLQALFQGVVVGVVALYLYARTVDLLGPVQAALFVPLVPLISAVSDFLYLGERPTDFEIGGMIVVVSAMTLAIVTSRETRAAA